MTDPLWRGQSRPTADRQADNSFVGIVTVPVPPWTEVVFIAADEYDRLKRLEAQWESL